MFKILGKVTCAFLSRKEFASRPPFPVYVYKKMNVKPRTEGKSQCWLLFSLQRLCLENHSPLIVAVNLRCALVNTVSDAKLSNMVGSLARSPNSAPC